VTRPQHLWRDGIQEQQQKGANVDAGGGVMEPEKDIPDHYATLEEQRWQLQQFSASVDCEKNDDGQTFSA